MQHHRKHVPEDAADRAPRVTLGELVALRGRARALRLRSRQPSRAARSGERRSVFRGRGLEFDEVRPYQPGDDARDIDWRVTARRGRTYVKVYREERELPVMLLVDLGPGMYFGTRRQFKSVLAARVAALCAWAAMQGGGRVGGLVLGREESALLRPRARRSGVLPLLKAMERLQPRGPDQPRPGVLNQALERLGRIAPAGGIVLVISDFLGLEPGAGPLLARLARRGQCRGLLVSDPFERQLPPGAAPLRLGVPGRLLRVDPAARRTRELWRESFARRREALEGLFGRTGLILLSTDQDPAPVLARSLGVRRALP